MNFLVKAEYARLKRLKKAYQKLGFLLTSVTKPAVGKQQSMTSIHHLKGPFQNHAATCRYVASPLISAGQLFILFLTIQGQKPKSYT